MVTPSAYAIGNSVGDDQGQLVAAPSKDRAKKSSASASQSKYGALPPKAWYLVDEGILNFDRAKQVQDAKKPSTAPQKETSDNAVANISH